MTKETIKELEEISAYCMDGYCEDCIYSYGEFMNCFFLNAPYKWNIKELKRTRGSDDGKN